MEKQIIFRCNACGFSQDCELEVDFDDVPYLCPYGVEKPAWYKWERQDVKWEKEQE